MMREQILMIIANNPGIRKCEIAAYLCVWQCSFDFLATIDDLCEDGLIHAVAYKNPAQMEYYDKWYIGKA